MCCFSIEMSDVLVGIRQWDIQANAERLVGASTSTYLGDLNGHSWRGRRRRGRGRRESFVPFSVFSHSIPILSLHFFLLEKAVGLGRRWSPSRAHMHGSTAGEDKSPGADSWSFLLVIYCIYSSWGLWTNTHNWGVWYPWHDWLPWMNYKEHIYRWWFDVVWFVACRGWFWRF